MSTLVNVPKNGSLANVNSQTSFPNWSNWIDNFLNNDQLPLLNSLNFNRGITLPKVNILETADAYAVQMAVPGLKKTDFHIDLEEQLLSISAELQEEHDSPDAQYTRREFGYSSFKRTFSLPETVNDDQIEASYNDGILSIHLPKKEEAKRKPAKTIKIS
ncbi:Hsp20/alpha crystallin family protein [Arenibacter aquaticus]|uniref:Hsp20/alpha crystallin family protein n=1 Tax=Arenibacter aquaticus TaxID=2489054 RepID=A0A3S0BUP9_9FLAO|nr:Hsp20/alpha crystallin family protein [Arenibacter aquaticus]RTE52001.1 Hsp20/alpha crystallin family protein [Arenibacter aquaticus]